MSDQLISNSISFYRRPYTEQELELSVNIRIKPKDFDYRTIAFNRETFDLLKEFQRVLEGQIRRHTTNAEVLAYLILTHPEITNI